MRALVTGAAGFVGRHLVAHLEGAGDDVTGTDIATGGPDLDDRDAIRRLVTDAAPDVVYHLAGQADVGLSWREPDATWSANLHGTLNLLQAARDAGVGRVVSVTSADVYGRVTPDELPLTEDAPFRPASPYAASKAAADLACLQAHLGYDQDVIRVRAFNHLGPGQSDRFVASAIASRLVRSELAGSGTVPVGNLAARRDFTDVRDVVRAYRLVATGGRAGAAYNVCSGVDVGIDEIVDRLLALVGGSITVEVDPELERPVDLPVLRGSAEALRADTGWTPTISLDQTLRDVLERWRHDLADDPKRTMT